MYSDIITLSDALFITVLSITIVFCILLLIAFCIMSFKYIFKEENIKSQQKPQATKKVNVAQTPAFDIKTIENDEDKMVAVMVATINSNENDEDKIYRVTNVREI